MQTPRRFDTRQAPAASGDAVVLLAVLLVAMTLIAYLPALWEAGFIWDDDDYITTNVTLHSLDGLRRMWLEPGAVPQYYPLTFTTFWVEHHLWGQQPLGYHVVNVLLHGLNAVLLWLVLRRLRVPAAWMAAAVFALHPMQVESVAWITERKNVLSGLFALSAILVYLEKLAPGRGTRGNHLARRWYLALCVLFACALWSKTVTCSLPAVLLLIAWWQHGTIDRRTVWRLAPLFILGLAMATVTVWMEQHHVGAEGNEWALSLVERCLIAGRAVWFYPRTLLWPRNLTFIYPHWSIDAGAWWQYLFPLSAMAAIITLYVARGRLGRGPLVATLCYAGALTPALGFINVFPMRFSFVADHFAYLPIVGLMVLISAGGAELMKRVGVVDRRLGYVAGAPILLVLAVLTARQCGIYRNLHVLWTDTLAKNPACWMAHHNLAVTLLGQSGRLDESIGHFEAALRIKPDFPDSHYNLGIAFIQARRLPEGIAQFREALRLNPDYLEAHNNLGGVLFETGQPREAIVQFEEALRLNPEFAEAHKNLGTVLTNIGELQKGIEQYEEALRLKPDFSEAHSNLGSALLLANRRQDAIEHFRQALRLNPDDPNAQINLQAAMQPGAEIIGDH